jgi:hypothetical protein
LYALDDQQIAKHARVQFKCGKCGEITVVNVVAKPGAAKATPVETQSVTPMPSFARGPRASHGEGTGQLTDPSLKLPADKTITLLLTSGPGKGRKIPLTRPRTVIGRSGTDVEIPDTEISRWHCAIEVKDQMIRLRDLDSTNGIYMEEERVRVAELSHGSEFRIGSTVVCISVTPK